MDSPIESKVVRDSLSAEIGRGRRGAAFGFVEGMGWGAIPGLIMLALAALGVWNGRGFKGAVFFLVLGMLICSALGSLIGSILPRAVRRVLGCLVGAFIGYVVGGATVGGMWSPHYVRAMLLGGIAGGIIGFILGKHRIRTLATAWKRKTLGPLEIPKKG